MADLERLLEELKERDGRAAIVYVRSTYGRLKIVEETAPEARP